MLTVILLCIDKPSCCNPQIARLIFPPPTQLHDTMRLSTPAAPTPPEPATSSTTWDTLVGNGARQPSFNTETYCEEQNVACAHEWCGVARLRTCESQTNLKEGNTRYAWFRNVRLGGRCSFLMSQHAELGWVCCAASQVINAWGHPFGEYMETVIGNLGAGWCRISATFLFSGTTLRVENVVLF